MGRFLGVCILQHDSTREFRRRVSNASDQGLQMAGPLAVVHDDSVGARIGKALLDRALYILTHLGSARHLREVIGVKSDVGVFYHLEPQILWERRVSARPGVRS